MLTKNPEDYLDSKGQPHVLVALRHNSNLSAQTSGLGGRRLRGELNNDKSAEIDNSGALHVDVTYYLAHQIHPVISRLCAPVEGTSPAQIAHCLTLDPSVYQSSASSVVYGAEDDIESEAILL
ncbi:unnamed protein product [Protopolystoma xenopodis]|uniref:DNA-directed DNA polymerase n=1 Tax=Protopolystoma xenopodis TaxID=117903 RepID=A0A3S5C3Z2_9PLAT|nr:unnamed protein product [Protopolystoma xenopodis]